MFFNLNNWKKYKCTERIEEYVLNHASSYRNADQTVINNVIEEKYIVPLHPKFNYWGHIYKGARFWYQMRLGGFWSKKMIKEAKEHPVIIHYKGHVVHPWKKDSISSLYDRYHYYKPMTPWKDDVEYSIYYDQDKGCETEELRKKYNSQIRALRIHPLCFPVFKLLAKIKHSIWK
jgi:lipopolysaccharide biosynthesis glycosyltransferase